MKLFRKLWIGLLSGVATLAACNLVDPQPCYYGPPIVPENDSIENTNPKERRAMLKERIKNIRDILEERRNAEVYGPPEVINAYAKETQRLSDEADSLERELKALEGK